MANYQDRITTIKDILNMSPSKRKEHYCVNDGSKHIDKVTINGNIFTDYSAFSFLWEKSYIKEPVRSGDGSIGNLNSYATFLTPHLKIDFGLMSIDSYRKLMQLIYSGNEFLVTCYDVVNNKDTTNKMYFHTEEMPKLWTIVDALNGDENAIMLLGVQDYTIEMVGTNVAVEKITVNYYLNSPTVSGQMTPIYSEDFAIGEDFVLGANSSIESYSFEGYAFDGKWHLGDTEGTLYNNGDAFTITKANVDENSNSINLYAKWSPTNTYTLTYSYGLGQVQVDNTTLQEITSKQVQNGVSIGILPNSPIPSVEYDNKTYYPYSNGGWYKTSIKASNSQKLTQSTLYWLNQSTTIYQLYDTAKYLVTYIVDGNTYSTAEIEYGTQIPMPILSRVGYTFKGWEFNYNGKVLTSLTMPPFQVILTAKFEENKQ